MVPRRDAVIDACALLNVTATGEDVSVLEALGLRLIVGERVRGEVIYHLGPEDDDGVPTKEPVDLAELEDRGLLRTRALGEEFDEAFIKAAEQLTDLDAESVAIAATLKCPLVSDDPRVRSIARSSFPEVELLSTLELIHDAIGALGFSEEQTRELLSRLRHRGNFAPPRSLPRGDWYRDLLE